MTKSLEVTIDGKVVGLFVPPEDGTFGVMLGNVPRTYMRCQVTSGTDEESRYWQLPDIDEGQEITFRLVEAEPDSGRPPGKVVANDPEEVAARKIRAREAYRRARNEPNDT